MPVKSLVRVGGGWGEQPSEVLQAVRHFLFTLQAKALGFEPEWPLFVEADISGESRKE